MKELNSVTYGNPTFQQKDVLDRSTIVSDLFKELSKEDCPKNDSEATKQELNQIKDALSNLEKSNNYDLRRYLNMDKNLIQYIESLLRAEQVDESEMIQSMISDMQPLITKLKYKFQRPRPYQLANYMKLKLFPLQSTSALSPSFPSGHSVQAMVIMTVIGRKHPNLTQFCKRFYEDVMDSRVAIGVHYPSDNDFSVKVANAILEHPKFVDKYLK